MHKAKYKEFSYLDLHRHQQYEFEDRRLGGHQFVITNKMVTKIKRKHELGSDRPQIIK